METETTYPWIAPTVVSTAREAIYRESCKTVRGGVYEPFLTDPLWREAGLSLLACAGDVEEHCDSDSLPRYAYFAVIVNDGWIARQSWVEVGDLPVQYPGSFFRLDVHDEHELSWDDRVIPTNLEDDDVPGFAVLLFGSDELLNEEAVEERFHQSFAKLGDLFKDGVPHFPR